MSRATVGGHFGGGFDVHVARSFSLGLGVGYNAMVNFAEPVGGHKNFNGVQVSSASAGCSARATRRRSPGGARLADPVSLN